MATRARRFCFTLNNPEDDQAPLALKELAQYIVWQKEVAPTTGTIHLQGYVELKDVQRISALTKLMQAHYTVCNGDQQQNIAYCTKPGAVAGPWHFGEKKQENGKRKDLQNAINIAKSGASKKELIESQPEIFLRYRSGLLDIAATFAAQRTQQTHGIYVYGPPASGKTYFFRNLYKKAYWKDNSMWWHNYDGEDVVIWDEFESTKYSIQDIKMILNHAPWNAPFKGGYSSFTSKLVIFLSNSKIDEIYPEVDINHKTALLSRLRLFDMRDRKLIAMPSPHWESRFGLKHDDTLPTFVYNEEAKRQKVQESMDISQQDDFEEAEEITPEIPQSVSQSVYPSSHPRGESPNKLFVRPQWTNTNSEVYNKDKPQFFMAPIKTAPDTYTGEPRNGFNKRSKRPYASLDLPPHD